MPKFIKASEGLQKITRRQIEEIQVIKEPTPTLLTLAKAICTIMKVKPHILKFKEENFVSRESYWNAFLSNKLLGDYRILDKMTSIDPSEIEEETIMKLEILLQDESLSAAKVGHSSFAAKGLYRWVNAIRQYVIIYRESAP